MNYAIYVRQSVDKPDSVSIETQIEYCLHEVKGNPYKVYPDKGYSGKNTARPEFQTMIHDITNGKINAVVVYKLDRISRSILDFANMMLTFQNHEVDFISCTEKFDTSTPMGRAMLNICIVFAQLERETIQMRVSDAYESRSIKGFFMGGSIPYGFIKTPYEIAGKKTSMLVENAEEAAQIRMIFEMYSDPLITLGDVLRHLNSNELTKKRGIPWQTARLSEIIRNPIYVRADSDIYNFFKVRGAEIINNEDDFIGENGCYLFRKDATDHYKDVSKYDNLRLVLAPHNGLIDSDIWIKCRNKIEQNRQAHNGRISMRTWLGGKLKCGKCGYALRFNRQVNKTTTNEYFLCSNHLNYGKCEGFGVVHQKDLEIAVFEEMKRKVKDYKLREKKIDEKPLKEMQSISKTIEQKQKEINSLIEKLVVANESVTRYVNERVETLDIEISNLKGQLLQLQLQYEKHENLDVKSIEPYLNNWDHIELTDKQKIADLLIDRILATKTDLQIIWKMGLE